MEDFILRGMLRDKAEALGFLDECHHDWVYYDHETTMSDTVIERSYCIYCKTMKTEEFNGSHYRGVKDESNTKEV